MVKSVAWPSCGIADSCPLTEEEEKEEEGGRRGSWEEGRKKPRGWDYSVLGRPRPSVSLLDRLMNLLLYHHLVDFISLYFIYFLYDESGWPWGLDRPQLGTTRRDTNQTTLNSEGRLRHSATATTPSPPPPLRRTIITFGRRKPSTINQKAGVSFLPWLPISSKTLLNYYIYIFFQLSNINFQKINSEGFAAVEAAGRVMG